jgi:hypothetical protein
MSNQQTIRHGSEPRYVWVHTQRAGSSVWHCILWHLNDRMHPLGDIRAKQALLDDYACDCGAG